MKELSPDFTEFVEKKLRFPEKPLTTSQVVTTSELHKLSKFVTHTGLRGRAPQQKPRPIVLQGEINMSNDYQSPEYEGLNFRDYSEFLEKSWQPTLAYSSR